jgi:hypothetical protein
MKKSVYALILTILSSFALLLAGCSNSQAQAGTGAGISAGAGTASAGNGQGRQLDKSMQLALGTLALEDTDQAVSAEQAASLLPLWKAANSLTGADNVATEEMNGLFKQIEEAMSSDQVQAIQAMDLSGQGMADLASKYGFQMGSVGRRDITPEMQSTMEAARASGEMPQGFGPGGNGAPPDGGGGGPSFQFRGEGSGGGGQGFFAQRSNNSSSSGASATATTGNPIFQAVITLLEGKTQ